MEHVQVREWIELAASRRQHRLQLGAAEERGGARHDAEAQRLLDGAVRQVP